MNVSYLLLIDAGEMVMLDIILVGLEKFYESLHEVMTLELILRL